VNLGKASTGFQACFFIVHSWGWDEVSSTFHRLGNLRLSWKARVEISVLSQGLLFSECWKFLHFLELSLGIQGSRFHYHEIFLTSIVHLFIVYGVSTFRYQDPGNADVRR
jgi:hypothetical protein